MANGKKHRLRRANAAYSALVTRASNLASDGKVGEGDRQLLSQAMAEGHRVELRRVVEGIESKSAPKSRSSDRELEGVSSRRRSDGSFQPWGRNSESVYGRYW